MGWRSKTRRLPWNGPSESAHQQQTSGSNSAVDAEKALDNLPQPQRNSNRRNAGDGREVDERALLRKLDRRILPAVSVLYLLSFLDRSNVANANLLGLTEDLHMTADEYLTGLTLFFVGYILLEVVWNAVLKRVGPTVWLPTVTLAFGVVSTAQGLIQSNGGQSGVAGFFVVRVVLGFAEGALFPGIVFYLSTWYRRSERQYRIACFFSMASLAGAFGGILAWAIGLLDGIRGLPGWRWIFIIEGTLTGIVAIGAYYFIPDWPSKSNHFLSGQEQSCIISRLKVDGLGEDEDFSWAKVWETFRDPHVWLYSMVYHTLALPLYTLSLFMPTIISDLGYEAWEAQLLTVPPYALATTLTVGYAVVSERVGLRSPFIIASSLVAIIGYCILLGNNQTTSPGVSYCGVFFAAAGIYPAVALGLSWPAINLSGHTKRATAGALQITIGNLGAVIGTQIYRPSQKPDYVVGHSVALAYLGANIVVVGTLWWMLARTNRQRDANLERRPNGRIDGSWKGNEDVRWRFRV